MVNLITLLVSEDEGKHMHVSVSTVLSDPVHLGHHHVHFASGTHSMDVPSACSLHNCNIIFI